MALSNDAPRPLGIGWSDGTLLSDVTIGTPARELYAVALDPKIPDYRDDLTTKLARFVYTFGQAGSDPALPVHKVRLVQQTPLAGSPRETTILGISRAGAIRRFEMDGTVSTPTAAAGKLSGSPVFVQAVALFGKVYITDGVGQLVVYDPIEDTCSLFESTSGGEAPKAVKILEAWNGRLVFARSPDLIQGAHNWLMSARGKPTDLHTSPPERTSAAAIGGSNAAGPGIAPDIVNAFIPYNDDLAYWGCDHAIYQMTGDPGAGGEFDLVSDITGMAIGRCWCKDPRGNLWFVGSRGGLFFMPPGARPERISLRNIDARLSAIDFSTHTVRLAWNDDDQGVHIVFIPIGTPGEPVEHYFWDAKRGGAWPDTFEQAVEPTALYVVDGDDPEDRLLLLGGRDGYVRKWDAQVDDDDGLAIDQKLLIGSLADSGALREQRFVGPRVVLDSSLHGCRYELYVTDDPALLGPVRHSGELRPGRNPMMRTRMRGSYCFLMLRERRAGKRFAVEEASMLAFAAGQKRVRDI